MASTRSAKQFHDEKAAYAFVEARVWRDGRVCPHCGVIDQSGPLRGKSTRIGVYKCYVKECRKPFTVKVGTVFEASNVKLHLWLQAMYLLCAGKKGISSNQLSRTLGVTLKTAWFMSHRIREAMRSGDLSPFGTTGGAVEADETFIGRVKGAQVRTGGDHKMKVLSLIDRDTGRARSMVVDRVTAAAIVPLVRQNVAREAHLMTDEPRHYVHVGREFVGHSVVHHGRDEYVRYKTPLITTNTIEGFFSIFKRGMKGVYQHCGEKHLHRYLAEFDFRYSNRVGLGVNDVERTDRAILGIVGKRLTYRDSQAAAL